MHFSRRIFAALVVAIIACGANALAQKVEGTPIPTRAEPDFSSMQFLIGTWSCTDMSSRRPGPFTTTEVYSMDPTGYWMNLTTTVHRASWIPQESHTQTKYTWDPVAKLWIRIAVGDTGGYAVASAPAAASNKKTYTYVIQTKAADIGSYAPEVYTKVSNTQKSMVTSFTETSGHVVHVKETCTKS